MIDRWLKFFKQELWLHPPGGSSLRSFLHSFLRVIISAAKGFSSDECFLKASALTYYSLLSIVPVLAVAFGIAKGFGFEHRLEEEVLVQFHEQPEVAHKIIDFSYSLLEHTKGGLIAGIGAVGLFYTVLKLLENIELSLNSIWRVSAQRPWTRKFSDYLAMMICCPIFFAVASSTTIYFTTLIVKATRQIHILDYISPLIFFSLNIIPYLFSWLLFTFIYIFMPNTKVPWKAGLVAGIVAGTAYQVLQILYINVQIVVSNYNTIYGSFAALPLFLVWLNLSWLIVLAGAEIAYHQQRDRSNRVLAEYSANHSLTSVRIIGLYLVWQCVKAFQKGNPPIILPDISKNLGVPLSLLQEITDDLIDQKLLSEVVVSVSQENVGYQPAREINDIKIKTVCDALDKTNRRSIAVYPNPILSNIEKTYADYEELTAAQPMNFPLLNLAFSSTSDNSVSQG